MKDVLTLLSMLHEPAHINSATRQFRDQPVLHWTLARLRQARHLDTIVLLCWDDQLEAAAPATANSHVEIVSRGARQGIPVIDAITASRKWSDGWRGGVYGTCSFDAGFHGPWFAELASDYAASSILLIDPAAALVDPHLLEAILDRARAGDATELAFAQAAPGLAGLLLKRELLDRLAKTNLHPGRLLHYMPDQPIPDPIGGASCAPVPTRVARTAQSFLLNSQRQINRVTAAMCELNGQLIDTGAEELVRRLEAHASTDALPREIVLELTTRRATRPIFSPLAHLQINRPDLTFAQARGLLEQLGGCDDTRLTLAGVGDPLLVECAIDIIHAAKRSGVHALHVETDLLELDATRIESLVRSGVDVISVHLPAMSQATYTAVMGADRYLQVIQNLTALINARRAAGSGVPIISPIFTKCQANFAEMEAWYDQWLRVLGSAVIIGPTTCAGQIPDCGIADMTPASRKPCRRPRQRMTVLSDGRVVSCEQDVLGRQVMGSIDTEPLTMIWQREFAALRAAHDQSNFVQLPLCKACSEWHRP